MFVRKDEKTLEIEIKEKKRHKKTPPFAPKLQILSKTTIKIPNQVLRN